MRLRVNIPIQHSQELAFSHLIDTRDGTLIVRSYIAHVIIRGIPKMT